jgi:N-acetylmuramoyl-L-alanine amidase
VRDLQRRLAAAGCPPAGGLNGRFDQPTFDAVTAFQELRGLRPTGDCDEQTWLAICEAGWHLGDRALKLEAPQVRGDDVVALQQGLNHLGFDCGRPDGILGPATVRALVDFQRNSGINADGVCGPTTISMLERLLRQSGSGPGVATIREHEVRGGASTFEAARIVIGQFGGLSAITRGLARSLRNDGATVMSTDEYEATAHAAAANRFGATVYVGFEPRTEPGATIAYFAVPHFESFGGRALATSLAAALDGVVSGDPTIIGMRLPVLRETRMPAVVVTVGPVRAIVDAAETVSRAVEVALREWLRHMADDPTGALPRPVTAGDA